MALTALRTREDQINRMAQTSVAEARPFLKWAGGKGQLLAQLAACFPAELARGELRRYAEPFLGGGALFLTVAQHYPIEAAWLSDANPELALVYRVVQRDVEALIDQLAGLERRYLAGDDDARRAAFYAVRDAYNQDRGAIARACYAPQWVTRAAQMIFLNKTCFNGLYRLNRRGEFNVPFGRYRRPVICAAENLRRVAALLQRAEIACAPFTACAGWVDAGTFVYFDPPYRPLSATARFTAYAAHKFDDEDQIELARFFAHLHDTTGAKLMLSNSDPANVNPADDFFARHYGRFHLRRVWANRMINVQPDKRGKISELVITNYETSPAR